MIRSTLLKWRLAMTTRRGQFLTWLVRTQLRWSSKSRWFLLGCAIVNLAGIIGRGQSDWLAVFNGFASGICLSGAGYDWVSSKHQIIFDEYKDTIAVGTKVIKAQRQLIDTYERELVKQLMSTPS